MEILSPDNEEGIADLVKSASARRSGLRIQGGATRSGIGNPVVSNQTLSMSGLAGISLYEPGSLHMVAGAGTPMAEIEKALDAEGQMLAFEPMDHRSLLGTKGEPTIGGVVAGNVSGPRRFLAGACRDHLLGVRFVNGEGDVIKSGGRVMKNVTGLDLAKLQCGAWGSLGILTEVSLKTLPKPETGLTIAIEEVDVQNAVPLFSKALASPYEVSGAAWIGGTAFLRLEGFEIQVKSRQGALMELLNGHAVRKVVGKAHHRLWRDIRDVKHFAGKEENVWRISVKPTDAPTVIAKLDDELNCDVSLDWGGGLIWLSMTGEEASSAQKIRERVNAVGGHATLIRGSAELREACDVFHPEPSRLAHIAQGLRMQFDPAGIFNSGIMAGA